MAHTLLSMSIPVVAEACEEGSREAPAPLAVAVSVRTSRSRPPSSRAVKVLWARPLDQRPCARVKGRAASEGVADRRSSAEAGGSCQPWLLHKRRAQAWMCKFFHVEDVRMVGSS